MTETKRSVKKKLEDAEELYKALNQAETKITQDITLAEMNRDRVYGEAKFLYEQGSHNYGWPLERQDYVQRLEATLLNTWGLKYRSYGKEKRLHFVMDERIANLYKRMQHGCNNLAKEKQILNDIKQAEEEKKRLINAADATKNDRPTHLRSVENIEGTIRDYECWNDELLSKDMSERAERNDVWKDAEWYDGYIYRLENKLADIKRKKHATETFVAALKQQRDEVEVHNCHTSNQACTVDEARSEPIFEIKSWPPKRATRRGQSRPKHAMYYYVFK